MNISIIITAHNEGHDLETTATLASYGSTRPHEIIVVDDCSDEPVGDRLDHIERTSVWRTPSQLGVAASRNFGAMKATGDVLIFLDSHMRMPDWWLEAITEAVEKHPSAIICPACVAFNKGFGSDFHGCGARFDPEKIGLEPAWLTPTPGTRDLDICPCILGACYIVPRPIWRALRGFNPNFHGWGQDEQDLSLRAWIAGFEVRRMHHLIVSHRWNRNLPGYFLNSWEPGYNSIVSCYSLFEDDAFFDRYHNTLRDRWPDAKAWHLFIEKECSIRKFRRWVQAHRVRSDEEIESIIGPFIPQINQQPENRHEF